MLRASESYRCLLFPEGSKVEAQDRERSEWLVELAITDEEQYRGLSDRPSLAARHGMLFVYPKPALLTFCMRRCFISLDIAFISAEMSVFRMETMMAERYGQEWRIYSSGAPAQYALEVNAGELSASGVREGDRMWFSDELKGRLADIRGRSSARK